MKKKTYLDIHPHCDGCPLYQYCGTMVQSTKACNSYVDPEEEYLEQWLEEMFEALDDDYYAMIAEEIELEEIAMEEEVEYWAEFWEDIRLMQEP